MNAFTSLSAFISNRKQDERGATMIEILVAIALFCVVASTLGVVMVQAGQIQQDNAIKVSSEATDQIALQAIRGDFYYGEVASVSQYEVTGFTPNGEEVSYKLRETGDFVRTSGESERVLTSIENYEGFSFEVVGNQVMFSLDSISSAITPDKFAPEVVSAGVGN